MVHPGGGAMSRCHNGFIQETDLMSYLPMPNFENGFETSGSGLLMGLVQSSFIMILASAFAGAGGLVSAILATASVIGILELASRMNYWGIAYTGGWVLGLF